jgi:hypothetical protein
MDCFPGYQLRFQKINIELRLTGVPIRFVKFGSFRKLRSLEVGQPPIYYLFESESVSIYREYPLNLQINLGSVRARPGRARQESENLPRGRASKHQWRNIGQGPLPSNFFGLTHRNINSNHWSYSWVD